MVPAHGLRSQELMAALQFHLVVHSPLQPLRGFAIELRAFMPGAKVDELHSDASKRVMEWLCTDAVLVYPPSQVALSALFDAASRLQVDLKPYTAKITEGDEAKLASLEAAIQGVQDAVGQEAQTDSTATATLLAKLSKCRNPRYDPKSAAFARLREQREVHEQAQKRKRRRNQLDNLT